MHKKGHDFALNRAFIATGVPYVCLCEQAKAHLDIVGRSYFTVEQSEAALARFKGDKESIEKVVPLEEGCSHYDSPRASTKDHILVQTLFNLIK